MSLFRYLSRVFLLVTGLIASLSSSSSVSAYVPMLNDHHHPISRRGSSKTMATTFDHRPHRPLLERTRYRNQSPCLHHMNKKGDCEQQQDENMVATTSPKSSSKSSSFEIRKCLYEDLRQVADLMLLSFYDSQQPAFLRKIFELAEWNRLQQNFPYADQADQHGMYVAVQTTTVGKDDDTKTKNKQDQRVVGFVDVDARPCRTDIRPVLPRPYVSDLCVHPDFRRKGLAKQMIVQSENFLRNRKTTIGTQDKHEEVVWIRVQQDNPAALTLYTQLGYAVADYRVEEGQTILMSSDHVTTTTSLAPTRNDISVLEVKPVTVATTTKRNDGNAEILALYKALR